MHVLHNNLMVLFHIFYWNSFHSSFLLCIYFNLTLDDLQLPTCQNNFQNNVAVKSCADSGNLIERVCSIFVNSSMCRVFFYCQGLSKEKVSISVWSGKIRESQGNFQ